MLLYVSIQSWGGSDSGQMDSEYAYDDIQEVKTDKDGFVYLVDDCDMTVDKINSSYCYFKARQMQYRIIPD